MSNALLLTTEQTHNNYTKPKEANVTVNTDVLYQLFSPSRRFAMLHTINKKTVPLYFQCLIIDVDLINNCTCLKGQPNNLTHIKYLH